MSTKPDLSNSGSSRSASATNPIPHPQRPPRQSAPTTPSQPRALPPLSAHRLPMAHLPFNPPATRGVRVHTTPPVVANLDCILVKHAVYQPHLQFQRERRQDYSVDQTGHQCRMPPLTRALGRLDAFFPAAGGITSLLSRPLTTAQKALLLANAGKRARDSHKTARRVLLSP